MDGTEICIECSHLVKIGDCYGHARNCSELCRKCRRVEQMRLDDIHTWLNEWREKNFTSDGKMKPPLSLIILGLSLGLGVLLTYYY